MKTITQILFASLFFIAPFALKSTHIVGGTFKYEILEVVNEIATVEVTLYVYRDNNGGAFFDQNLELGLYKYNSSEYNFITRQFVSLSSFKTLEINNVLGCSNAMINYELGIYITQIDIPLNNYEHFTLAYQRCCRDDLISNIKNPGETGIAISFDLYPKAFSIINQPVLMNNLLPLVNATGVATDFDLSVEDNFDKVYYLSTPKASGGVLGTVFGDPSDCEGITPNPQNCTPEFDDVEYLDSAYPYGNEATLEIDSESGILNIEIPEISKILVGITLDRYSDDELFCRIRQQFLVNTFDCTIASTKDKIEKDVKIWPVPSGGNIYFGNSLQNISIFNAAGDCQHFQSLNKFSNHIDLQHLPKAVYIMKGQTSEGKWVSSKIIILD